MRLQWRSGRGSVSCRRRECSIRAALNEIVRDIEDMVNDPALRMSKPAKRTMRVHWTKLGQHK